MLIQMVKWLCVGLALGAIGLWLNWQFSAPSHDRQWQALYERLPGVTESGDTHRLTHIRNWSYAPDGTPSPAWIDATIDPATLVDVYFIVEPFGEIRAVAHTMLAFEFADGQGLVASVEARREVGEPYGGLKAGVLPMHEYMFVWTTERDMYANSTFFTGDDLYLYRLDIPEDAKRAVLMAMLADTAELIRAPQWYNTFLSNCTNVLARAVNRVTPDAVPWDVAWYLPGYAAEFLFDQGMIAGDSFADLEARSHITPHVRAIYAEEDPARFSEALRARLWGG